MSLSVNAIVISDLVPFSYGRTPGAWFGTMAGSFFVGKRHSMLQFINNETRLNRIAIISLSISLRFTLGTTNLL